MSSGIDRSETFRNLCGSLQGGVGSAISGRLKGKDGVIPGWQRTDKLGNMGD